MSANFKEVHAKKEFFFLFSLLSPMMKSPENYWGQLNFLDSFQVS